MEQKQKLTISQKIFGSGRMTIEKLDMVLEEIFVHDKLLDKENIYFEINKFESKDKKADDDNLEKISMRDIEKALSKLKRDIYIEYDDLNKKYTPTYEGIMFYSSKTYAKEKIISDLNLKIQQNEMRRRTRNDLLLVIGTIGAAIGTLSLTYFEIKKDYPYFLQFWKY